jgi:uncharacterized protein YecE (DUF72 family)
MTGRLFIGCPMWANRDWVGPQFPAATRAGDELGQYAQWCNAVEGNTTFYALPSGDTVRRWAEATPPSFHFVFKLPRSITHEQRLRGVDAELTAFLRLLEPLGERCGPLSVQLPPTFGPGDLGALTAFLRRAPRAVRWAVEVRNPAFFDGGRAHQHLDRLLGDAGAERVILDTRTLFAKPPTDDAERQCWTSKPRVPVIPKALTDTPVVRLIGRTRDADTIEGWQPWFPVLASWIEAGHAPHVFVHTPDNVAALRLARQFHADLTAFGCDAGALPVPPAPVTASAQGTLFDAT